MILNSSIGNGIEQCAEEIEGHGIPKITGGPPSAHSTDVVEKSEPRVVNSAVPPKKEMSGPRQR